MQEGTIEEWLVAPGTAVAIGDPILRLSTDKVDVEVEAEGHGLLHPVAVAGSVLAPGTVIGWLLDSGESLPGAVAPVAVAPVVDAAPADRLLSSPNARRVAAEMGIDLSSLSGTGPGGRIVSADVEAAAAALPAHAVEPPPASTPLVRREARAAGVDLATVVGSGPGGRIRRSDV